MPNRKNNHIKKFLVKSSTTLGYFRFCPHFPFNTLSTLFKLVHYSVPIILSMPSISYLLTCRSSAKVTIISFVEHKEMYSSKYKATTALQGLLDRNTAKFNPKRALHLFEKSYLMLFERPKLVYDETWSKLRIQVKLYLSLSFNLLQCLSMSMPIHFNSIILQADEIQNSNATMKKQIFAMLVFSTS